MAKQNVNANQFKVIERVWAANGVVNILTKDGRASTLTAKQAAERALALNRMDIPDWYKKTRNDLVEKIIEACREARAQQEDPRDNKTKAVVNALKGKSLDGKDVTETVDQQVQRYMFMFHTITEGEAEAVASNKDYSIPQKEIVLKEIHRQRMASSTSLNPPNIII